MDFREWLLRELDVRGWSPTDLSRATHMSTKVCYGWVRGDPGKRVKPSPDACKKIAEALGIPASEPLERAGYIQPLLHVSMNIDIDQELMALEGILRSGWGEASPESKTVAAATIRALFQADGHGGRKRRGTGFRVSASGGETHTGPYIDQTLSRLANRGRSSAGAERAIGRAACLV